MASVAVHRGPDDEGVYADSGIAMGMRRLSIIDLAHGHQPISNEDQSLWIVCNGEIYNFVELRDRLTALGHRFRTGSDSEVILHLYEDHGVGCLEQLEGIFGFAIWDVRRRRLVLGRDRLGVKPLYFYRDDRRLVFASEAKSILEAPGISAEVDPVGLEEYLSLGYTPTAQSIFRGIEKLPPASVLVHDAHGIEISRYWDVPQGDIEHADERDWCARIRHEIERSVVSEMVSDVPLAAFLSGGIDSSAIVAMMATNSSLPVRTYSIGFDADSAGAYYNELPYAREVSQLFHTDHKEILVRPNVAELLPKLLWHMDEPVADSAFITTYLVAEFARKDVTVILSGVGGDELFGGYRRYLGEYYTQKYRLIPAWLRRRIVSPIADLLPGDRHSSLMNLSRLAGSFLRSAELPLEERYRSYVQVFGPDSLERLLKAGRNGEVDSLDRAFEIAHGDDALRRIMNVDLLTQLPDDMLMLTDKMTMAASIECRVPLLNHRLIELVARVPTSMKVKDRSLKYILKSALADTLPKKILHRKKRGFGAPFGAWVRHELAPLVNRVLSRESVERRKLFDWPEIKQTIELHNAQKADNTDHLLALLNFEVWARIYLDRRSSSDVADELAAELTGTTAVPAKRARAKELVQ